MEIQTRRKSEELKLSELSRLNLGQVPPSKPVSVLPKSSLASPKCASPATPASQTCSTPTQESPPTAVFASQDVRLKQKAGQSKERLDKSSLRGVTIRESPRKRVRNENNLRTKLRKTQRKHKVTEDTLDQVKIVAPKVDMEMDEDVLNRREKQISYGKNTVDYDKYTDLVKRADRGNIMPRTPRKNNKYSRRQWDGLVRTWKQGIHTTVLALEGVDEEMETSAGPEWKLEDKPSSIGSWAEEMEAEEVSCRVGSSTCLSSDQNQFFNNTSSSPESEWDSIENE